MSARIGRVPPLPRRRSVVITTDWSGDEVARVLEFLDELRRGIETAYARELGGAYHDGECHGAHERQGDLELDDPPF